MLKNHDKNFRIKNKNEISESNKFKFRIFVLFCFAIFEYLNYVFNNNDLIILLEKKIRFLTL